MEQIKLPQNFVTFADAIKILYESQRDVTELVSKWDDIVNTDTPGTVDITLSSGVTKKVDNLAKIRNDLVKGLGLDEPTVRAIHFNGYRSKSTVTGMTQYGIEYKDGTSGNSPLFGDQFGGYRNIWNTMYSVCLPKSNNITLSLHNVPRIIMLGVNVFDGQQNVYITDYTINITAPPNSYITSGVMANEQYCTLVTFINRNFGADPTNVIHGQVTLRIKSGTFEVSRKIDPDKSVTYALFAAPGADVVNAHEIVL